MLSLWDVTEAWREVQGLASQKLQKETADAVASPLSLFHALLSRICQMASPKQTFELPEWPGQSRLQGAHRAALIRYLAVDDDNASASDTSFTTIIGIADSLTRAQVRNALMVLRLKTKGFDCESFHGKKRNASGSILEENSAGTNADETTNTREARQALADYWRQRLVHQVVNAGTQRQAQAKTPLGSIDAVLAYAASVSPVKPSMQTLLHVEHLKKSARRGAEQKNTLRPILCLVCGDAAFAEIGLRHVSCGRHVLPLCQRTLLPLLLEPVLICTFCDRYTFAGAPSPASASHSDTARDEEGLCAWCASPVVAPTL